MLNLSTFKDAGEPGHKQILGLNTVEGLSEVLVISKIFNITELQRQQHMAHPVYLHYCLVRVRTKAVKILQRYKHHTPQTRVWYTVHTA